MPGCFYFSKSSLKETPTFIRLYTTEVLTVPAVNTLRFQWVIMQSASWFIPSKNGYPEHLPAWAFRQHWNYSTKYQNLTLVPPVLETQKIPQTTEWSKAKGSKCRCKTVKNIFKSNLKNLLPGCYSTMQHQKH